MKALVLSGGGNYGAMQAGALEVLLEHGYRPEMLVGNSAGSLNSLRLAADPSPEGVAELQESWREVTKEQVGSVSLLAGLRQLVLKGDGLFPNEPLLKFLRAQLPHATETFADLTAVHGIEVYALAANVRDGTPRVFGDCPQDRVLDGAMASIALPPYLPPWPVGGERYIDGGVYSNLPLKTAIERGATELVALWIRPPVKMMGRDEGLLQISSTAFNLMSQSLSAAEIEFVQRSGVKLQVFELHPPEQVKFWDFDQAERLIEAGRAAAREFKLQGRTGPRWRRWLLRLVRGRAAGSGSSSDGIANRGPDRYNRSRGG